MCKALSVHSLHFSGEQTDSAWHWPHTSLPVMTSSQKVDFRMGCQDPESIVLPSESLYSCALGQIPDPDTLVLRVGHYHILT